MISPDLENLENDKPERLVRKVRDGARGVELWMRRAETPPHRFRRDQRLWRAVPDAELGKARSQRPQVQGRYADEIMQMTKAT